MRLEESLSGLRPSVAVAVSLGTTLLLGGLDVLTGSELEISVLYLAPVGLATWAAGRGAGIGFSILSATLWCVANAPAHHFSRPWLVYWNGGVLFAFFLVATESLNALKHALHYARTDHLTGLPNSRSFRDATAAEIERARRYQKPFTVAYLDVDGFKAVNDDHGHTSGDDLLRLIATTLSACLRRTDLAARLGGDEFAILLPETDVDASRLATQKVRIALTAAVAATRWPVTFSIGVVTFVRAPKAIEQALHVADVTMYSVKHGGRNRVRHVTFGGEAA